MRIIRVIARRPTPASSAHRLNVLIIAALSIAVMLPGWCVLHPKPAQPTAQAAVAVSPSHGAAPAPGNAIPAKSIAVFPFRNLSPDPDNAYFVDGLQDLILTRLADIHELKAIARTPTARLASHAENLAELRRELGIATILEVGVEKARNGARLRGCRLEPPQTAAYLRAVRIGVR